MSEPDGVYLRKIPIREDSFCREKYTDVFFNPPNMTRGKKFINLELDKERLLGIVCFEQYIEEMTEEKFSEIWAVLEKVGMASFKSDFSGKFAKLNWLRIRRSPTLLFMELQLGAWLMQDSGDALRFVPLADCDEKLLPDFARESLKSPAMREKWDALHRPFRDYFTF